MNYREVQLRFFVEHSGYCACNDSSNCAIVHVGSYLDPPVVTEEKWMSVLRTGSK
jgi:hypothetical protein